MEPKASSNLRISDVPDGTVLYDGVCVLCSAWFRFVATRDPQIRFRFTPIQGPYGRSLAIRLGIDPDRPQTNATIIGGVPYLRSDAALQILRRLPGWSWSGLLLTIPRFVRDTAYTNIARNRYRLFGRAESCLVPDAQLARHLLMSAEPGESPDPGQRPLQTSSGTMTAPMFTPGHRQEPATIAAVTVMAERN